MGVKLLPLREEHRMRIFENRELKRIFASKKDEIVGSWRNLRNQELYNFYYSPNIIIMIN
jgi:hypothetical protein